MPIDNPPFQKVRWHSRRGMLELDLVLVPFADRHYEALAEEDQRRYVQLLACEDQDLLAWLLGHAEPADPELAHIVNHIRTCHGSATPPAPGLSSRD